MLLGDMTRHGLVNTSSDLATIIWVASKKVLSPLTT